MRNVLIDTSVLLDLVLLYQQRHRRNRSVASSAAAAVEALILYEKPLVEGASFNGILEAGTDSRFLRFYCDDQAETALEQFAGLRTFCEVLNLSSMEIVALHQRAASALEDSLAMIDDPDDLRAYELYDYLPYHLGEDPTAIECRLTNACVADLELVDLGAQSGWKEWLDRTAACLKERRHPTRAAWALPLIRLYYYDALQEMKSVHFIPHATKSTIAFGREAQTVAYRRLLDYCTDEFRSTYVTYARENLGGLMLVLPIPAFADTLLGRIRRWTDLVSAISQFRESTGAVGYRNELRALMERLEEAPALEDVRPELEGIYQRLESSCREWGSQLGIGDQRRRVRVALPFIVAPEAPVGVANVFMLVHDLFSAIGITGA